ncbi:hypothetical protein A1O1_00668 [Capronia coronata CBS 617.96]|uniref:N-acetyltransferase n=1 Tax=Capronia coronata CBS 617.96 TaxID=1182541 RepID=W9Z1U6_9EURO|nr:uncharacterized protein A1O1_00668 [Capronia coronata CBS 617.96]EXJ95546.1 hypothetical protein A1O1_00668 [Capronia coronata CBS 617.96]
MPSVVYPYTVTNSYKGGLFMRTYSRNVRRAWDGEDYRAPKRQRLNDAWNAHSSSCAAGANENTMNDVDMEDSLERAIRETSVAALSSSPSRKNSTIFSAESQEDDLGSSTITPPSSPPPELQLTPPNIKARKPTFSFLDKAKKEKEKKEKSAKRKRVGPSTGPDSAANTRLDSEPLSEILNSSARGQGAQPPTNDASNVHNLDQTPRQSTQASKPAAPKQHLIQTILDLGQPLVPTTCPQCQMSYTPSLPEDTQLHNMYHNRHSSGIEMGKPFLKSAMRWCYQVPHIPGSVVVVDRKIAIPGRRAVQKVLEIVNKELGSVDIKEEELWSQRALEGEREDDPQTRKCDRYKAFLHIVDDKCVGICLAERITKAHRVLPGETATSETIPLNDHVQPAGPATPAATETSHEQVAENPPKPQIPTPVASPTASFASSSITISEETYPAVVGVSRIWTSRAFRHKGIANNLLECVMSQFIYGMEIEPQQVAFSQPTESGAGLARAWFGENDGWAVYREE